MVGEGDGVVRVCLVADLSKTSISISLNTTTAAGTATGMP